MNIRIFALIIIWGGLTSAGVNPSVPYTQVTEKEASSFATVGKSQKEVIKEFGPPNITDSHNGCEISTYLTDPSQMPPHIAYIGFDVYYKDKKIIRLVIIRGRKGD
jgi:hypothetical protein